MLLVKVVVMGRDSMTMLRALVVVIASTPTPRV